MKHTYPLKVCPWCGVTPVFRMSCDERDDSLPFKQTKTWTPQILCNNSSCKVQPKAHYVPIRKKQKLNAAVIKEKIERAIKFWNDGNLAFKNEGFQLDFDKIVQDYIDGKLGLPGYRQEK